MKLLFRQVAFKKWQATLEIEGQHAYTTASWPTVGCAAKDALNWLSRTYGMPTVVRLDIEEWE